MTKHVIPLGVTAASLLALASSASADVKINDNISAAGYITGSYRYFDKAKTDKFDLDTAKLSILTTHAPVTAVASVYYTGGSPGDDLTLLDAYVNYDAGDGITVTGGKFLSWLGFEAFDIPNMTQLSYANGDFLGVIPGYHSGVKVNYATDGLALGAAVLDSVYGGLEGDGELRGNGGVEFYATYTGNEKLTIFAGLAHQTEGTLTAGIPDSGSQEEATAFNVWASYQLSSTVLLPAEYAVKESYFADGYNWLVFGSVATSDKVSLVGRISGEEIDNGPSFLKYTFAPTYKLTENLSIRGEISRYDYEDYSISEDMFFGVQAVFKF